MSDARRVRRQLETAFQGPAWHGPSLMENVKGVTADVATARPLPHAHSIWEIVNHVTAWQNEGIAVIGGKSYVSLTGVEDWPPAAGSWDEAVAALVASHERLCSLIDGLSDEKLRSQEPGAKYPLIVFMRGIAEHNLYHGGQIGLLRSAAK